MTKRTTERVDDARRWKAEGRSWAEVTEMVNRTGRPVTEGAVRHWLRAAAPAVAPAPRPPVVAAEPPRAPAAASVARPEQVDVAEQGDIGPDELRALLAGELRRHQSEAERAMADGRPGDARQSSRLVAAFTAQLQRIHARQDEDVETVRVKVADMTAAGERALAGLASTLEAVLAEVAGWARCPTCGARRGEFAGGASLVRGLFERAVRGVFG